MKLARLFYLVNSDPVFYGMVARGSLMEVRVTHRQPRTRAPVAKDAGIVERLGKALGFSRKTQAEIARELGVSPALISEWLTGRTRISFERAVRFAQTTGVNVSWLGEGVGDIARTRESLVENSARSIQERIDTLQQGYDTLSGKLGGTKRAKRRHTKQ